MKTFGEKLLNFAQSVDSLTNDNVRDLKPILFDHLKSKAGAATIEVCIETPFVGGDGLRYTWYSETNPPGSHPLFKDEKKTVYYGQTSYAYTKNWDLWIVASDDSKLAGSAQYINLLSDDRTCDSEIPPYIAYTGVPDIRTSIILPFRKKGQSGCQPQGLLNIEFPDRLKAYSTLKAELLNIRSAVEILLQLESTSELNRTNTSIAINTLREQSKLTSSLKLPKIFVGFPGAHDKAVSKSIANVLSLFFSRAQIVFWNEMHESGNINDHTFRAINDATFGIFYFSAQKDDGGFVDNPNVLFEAGMLHALSKNSAQEPTRWIPIREQEKLTGKIPFDMMSERILIVPRHPNGSLNTSEFEEQLRVRLSKLTGETCL